MRLGNLITEYNELNSNNEFTSIEDLQGINNDKYFQNCQSNKNDIDLSRYRICRRGMFAYNKATSRNGEKISIAYRDDKDCLVSPSYICFSINDEEVLMHEYLMLLFRRPIFDKYVRFHSWGSATEFFTYEDMEKVEIQLPSLPQQKEIVKQYNTFIERINCLKKENDLLENLAFSIYLETISRSHTTEVELGSLGLFVRGKNITQEEMIPGKIEVISAGLEPSGFHNAWNVAGPSITISASGVNAGFVSIHFDNIWAADCSFLNKNERLFFIYETLKTIKDKIDVLKDGHTGQPHVYAADLNQLLVPFFTEKNDLLKFNVNISPVFKIIENNVKQLKIIKQMTDTFVKNLG